MLRPRRMRAQFLRDAIGVKCAAFLAAALACLTFSAAAFGNAPVPPQVVAEWQTKAFSCSPGDGWTAFPARRSADADECADGDETLFNALLCSAGVDDGCKAVAASQAPSGRWYRSPRRAAMGARVCSADSATAEEKAAWCRDSFSPDMALGVELYALTTRDSKRLSSWLEWIEADRPCAISTPDGGCALGLPRFCTDDTANGCTIRPGDYGSLAITADALGLVQFGNNPDCSDTTSSLKVSGLFLRGLCTFKRLFDATTLASAEFNDAGYSQHLVGVGIQIGRKAYGDNVALQTAAIDLNKKQPLNPFFSFLAHGPSEEVRDLTIAACPKAGAAAPAPPTDWAWQRQDSEQAWLRSELWDCVFMAGLLK